MVTATPRVSIITIFLNAERFLEEAVRSVLEQTFADWELLLVDDGSTDESTEMARCFAAKDPRILHLEHPGHMNKGMPAARNLGLAHARGQYLALLDADDAWKPTRLEEHVSILETHPEAAMTYGPSLYWYGWSPDSSREDYVQKIGTEADRVVHPPDLVLGFLSGSVPTPCPSSVLVRTAAARDVGGFVEDMNGFFQVYEDQAFFFKITRKYPVFILSENLDFYRRHQDSCYSQAVRSGRKQLAKEHYLNWCVEQLTVNDPPSVRRAVRRQLWQLRHPNLTKLAGKRRHLMKRAGQLIRRLRNG